MEYKIKSIQDIPQVQLVKFIDYVYSFYGKGVGLYRKDYKNNGVSVLDIYSATHTYISRVNKQGTTWGGGDSVDREHVRDIMLQTLVKPE